MTTKSYMQAFQFKLQNSSHKTNIQGLEPGSNVSWINSHILANFDPKPQIYNPTHKPLNYNPDYVQSFPSKGLNLNVSLLELKHSCTLTLVRSCLICRKLTHGVLISPSCLPHGAGCWTPHKANHCSAKWPTGNSQREPCTYFINMFVDISDAAGSEKTAEQTEWSSWVLFTPISHPADNTDMTTDKRTRTAWNQKESSVVYRTEWKGRKKYQNIKVLLLTYKALNGQSPSYLSDLTHKPSISSILISFHFALF